MTQTLRMRIPPANIDRPSNGAIQNSGPPALCVRPRRRGSWNEKPSQDLSIDSKLKTPLMPVRGFCFFVDEFPSSAD